MMQTKQTWWDRVAAALGTVFPDKAAEVARYLATDYPGEYEGDLPKVLYDFRTWSGDVENPDDYGH